MRLKLSQALDPLVLAVDIGSTASDRAVRDRRQAIASAGSLVGRANSSPQTATSGK
jgi:hypothetical protein